MTTWPIYAAVACAAIGVGAVLLVPAGIDALRARRIDRRVGLGLNDTSLTCLACGLDYVVKKGTTAYKELLALSQNVDATHVGHLGRVNQLVGETNPHGCPWCQLMREHHIIGRVVPRRAPPVGLGKLCEAVKPEEATGTNSDFAYSDGHVTPIDDLNTQFPVGILGGSPFSSGTHHHFTGAHSSITDPDGPDLQARAIARETTPRGENAQYGAEQTQRSAGDLKPIRHDAPLDQESVTAPEARS